MAELPRLFAGGAAQLISRWTPAYREAVFDLILPIQTQEFGVPVTRADQPDLEQADVFYAEPGGLWFMRDADRIIGTIALKAIGDGQAALRKMFVAADYRGREHGVAKRLLDHLVAHARSQDISEVFLGTTRHFKAAHRFYEKNGFTAIAADDLPATFPRMAVDDTFYGLNLSL